MVTIEKDEYFFITVQDKDGIEQELNLTKTEMTELYGEIGKMLTKEYAEDVKEFFKKSKACDAISNQEIPSPDLDFNKIWLNSK